MYWDPDLEVEQYSPIESEEHEIVGEKLQNVTPAANQQLGSPRTSPMSPISEIWRYIDDIENLIRLSYGKP
jgi:hypothetical protein